MAEFLVSFQDGSVKHFFDHPYYGFTFFLSQKFAVPPSGGVAPPEGGTANFCLIEI